MTNNPIFNIGVNGSYPNETYSVTPKTDSAFIASVPFVDYPNWSGFWSDLGTILTRNYLNYHRSPLNRVIDSMDSNFYNFINYTNATYLTATDQFAINLAKDLNALQYIERANTISFTNASVINFNIASLRQTYKTPYEFNFFYVQLNNTNLRSYGYILYPNRIFLRPTNLTYNNSTKRWSLTTKAKILSSTFVSISDSLNIERDAYQSHRQRLTQLPTNIDLPSGLNSNNFVFNLYSCRSQVDYPAITFGTTVGSASSVVLDTTNDISYIYPDTTFITFSSTFFDIRTGVKSFLTQDQLSTDYLNLGQTFNPTFILKHDANLNNIQRFQLIQQSINPFSNLNTNAVPMSDTSNCVLSATIDLNNGTFRFFNPYAAAKISFPVGSYLGVNYIADCLTMQETGGAVTSTLNSFRINNISQNLNTNILGSTVGTNDIVWETNYPPHCYSYKVNLLNSAGNTQLDSNPLNFYVKLSADTVLNTTTLSAYIASDYNAISYGFDNSSTDRIFYQVVNTSLPSIDTFLNNITCTYGNGTPYTLTKAQTQATAQLIPVSQGKDLKITYNGVNFVGVSFTIKATLQSAAGQLDQFEPLYITMGIPSQSNGNSLFINTLAEQSNSIVLDSSFNVSASSWPSRDLTNSRILWYYDRTDLPLSFNYVDFNGNYIAPVNGPVDFSDETWTVALSGYGPNQVTISLSSAKYNEIASKSTNTNLYNFLENGKFIVTPLSNLNNLDLVRNIDLKAQIPYGDQIYNIPPTVPIYWTWEYDDIIDADLLPITANQILKNNNSYQYSSNAAASILSAIKINVTPGYSKTIPKLHKVKVIAQTDIVYPPVSGSYTFYVDDFPDPSIFNTDFATYYSSFTTSTAFQIANTRYEDNTVTRPNGNDFEITCIANNDVLTRIPNPNIYWTFNGQQTPNTTNTFTIDLNDPNLGLPRTTSYNYPITSAKIGLNLYSAIAPGWTSAHNVSATTNFYILSSTDFYKPLQFITYPEYAWIQPNPTYVTLLSTDPNLPSYYTNSYRPSAFGNKISNSQTFWMSANKGCFKEYIYQNLDTYNIVQTTSSYDLLDIPYNPFGVAASIGIPISLVGYNDTFYPENLDITYKILKSINGLPTLVTEYYNITAKTLEFTEPTNNVANNFFLSPIILPYNYLTLDFVPNQTVINLDINKNISITQRLSTLPSNSPAIFRGGTITYYLSSNFWTVSATVPAIDGEYSLFNLEIGDPAIPLNSGDLGLDNFYLYAKTNIIQQIPSSTFDNYSTVQYAKDRNLWRAINV